MNELFERHGVRPTPNRVLVWRQLNASWRPMSLIELEEQLQSLDRSSLFRTITLFKEKGIFSREVAASFRENILSKGGSEDEAEMYRKFRGHDPQVSALLRKLGI